MWEVETGTNGDGFPFEGLLDAAKANDTGTRAYLNILLFDEGLEFLDAAFVPVTMAAKEGGTNIPHEKLAEEVIVQQPGYAYIYLSNDNEQPLEVFFDDFTVTHSHSAIVQADDYYPFGMTFNSYRRELGKLNEYLYQGKERSEALGWDDFHARMYSPALGRFFGVDPQDQFASPFIGMGNNPVMMVDPDGELAWFVIPAIVGVVTGGINLAMNWKNIGGFWEGAGYFGVGFAAGAGATLGVTVAAPAVTAALGTGAYGGAALGAIGGGISGFAMGAGNTWMDGGSFGQGLGNGLVGAGTGAAFGAVTGGLISGTSSAIQGRNFWTGATKPLPTLDPVMPKGPSHLGTSDSKLPSKLDPVNPNALKELPMHSNLTQGNSRMGLEHINLRHFEHTGAPNVSKFSGEVGARQLRDIIQSGLSDPSRIVTQQGTRIVVESNVRKVIGTTQSGVATTWIRTVFTADGTVITSYPIPKP